MTVDADTSAHPRRAPTCASSRSAPWASCAAASRPAPPAASPQCLLPLTSRNDCVVAFLSRRRIRLDVGRARLHRRFGARYALTDRVGRDRHHVLTGCRLRRVFEAEIDDYAFDGLLFRPACRDSSSSPRPRGVLSSAARHHIHEHARFGQRRERGSRRARHAFVEQRRRASARFR